jgi:hypothetical protein
MGRDAEKRTVTHTTALTARSDIGRLQNVGWAANAQARVAFSIFLSNQPLRHAALIPIEPAKAGAAVTVHQPR